MLIIRAENGRSVDEFVVEDVETLEELQELIEEQQPIKALFIPRFYHWNIIVDDTLSYELVYLNNYNRVYDITKYIINREELRELNNNQCNKCTLARSDYGFNCRYKPDENKQCSNYDEEIPFKLIESIKNLFKS